MDSIVDGLMKQMMSSDNLTTIGQKVGADDKSTKSALEMGLPLLLGALSQKASTSEGSNSILSSIAGIAQGAGNPADDVSAYLGSPSSSQGSDLVSSLLGSSMQPIQQAVSQRTGLPANVVGQLLSMALPLLLGSLGQKSSPSPASNDLSKMLAEQSNLAMSSSPGAAEVMQQLIAPEKSGGIMGMLKKILKM